MSSLLFEGKYKRYNGIAKCPCCSVSFYKGHSKHIYCTKSCLDKYTRKKNQEVIHMYKINKGCELCGYKENAVALHFDHLEPKNKEFNISLDYKRPLNQMMEEIEKCRVLCANCHAIETYKNKHYTLDMSERGFVSGNNNYRRQTKRKS